MIKNKLTIEEVVMIYEERFHRLRLVERIKLIDWCRELSIDIVLWAMEQALSINCKAFIYVNKILLHYKKNIVQCVPV